MTRMTLGVLALVTLSACEDADALAELEARVEALEASAVLMIDEDMTIQVPTDEDTLAAAVASLDRYRIAPDATVVIQLEDGIHALDTTVEFQHPDGARIEVVGNADPGLVVLDYTGTDTALRVSNNAVLGLLTGVTVKGPASLGIGIEVVDGGVLICGQGGVVVEGFSAAFFANRGGILAADGTVARGSDIGYQASRGSVIDAVEAGASGLTTTGFLAETGSTIDATVSAANENWTGYDARDNATIIAVQATAAGNTGPGISAERGGFVDAYGALVEDNASFGLLAREGGFISAPEAGVTGSGDSDFAPVSSSDEHIGAEIYWVAPTR